MKKLLLIFLTTLLFSSCSKKEVPAINSSINPPPPPPPPQPPSGVLIGKKELFWEQHWDTAAGGYTTKLITWRLTQDQINNGVDVGIAILGADNSAWVTIPLSYYDPSLPGTIHLSYNATPGQLQVMAQTSFDMTKEKSDVYIEYK